MTIRFGNITLGSTYVTPASPARRRQLLELRSMSTQPSTNVDISGGGIAGTSIQSTLVDITGGSISGASLASSAINFTGGSIAGTCIATSSLSASSFASTGVDITGGSIAGVILSGSFSSSDMHISGGSIDGTPIGSTAASSANFTDVGVSGRWFNNAPVTKTADFTLASSEHWVIVNTTIACTVTMPSAALNTGRDVTFQSYADYAVASASANIVPLGGGAAGTAILSSVGGNWATVVSDGTNWVIMRSAPNNVLLLS